MARTECGHGHIYDSDIYPSCPYCNNGNIWVDIFEDSGARKATEGGPTMGPSGGFAGSVGGNAGSPMRYAAEDSGVTQAPLGYINGRKAAEDEQKTEAYGEGFGGDYEKIPVVGWLVCIKGKEKGKSFNVYSKINFIGRSDRNDICIKGDTTISKDKHARIAYEDKHNFFTFIPAESINNIYLNDQPIYVPSKLSAYDVIEMGNTKLLFIPLCSDKFKWADTIEKKE